MAIATYAELQTAIADDLARSDLSSFIPDFITMAENVLNFGSDEIEPLRVREMETISTVTMISGVGTVPAGFLQLIRAVEGTSSRRLLNYITADAAEKLYPTRSAGVPASFSIIGSNLYVYPLTDNSVELTYYGAIPALSDSNTSNWLLTKAPGVYLRTSLVMANTFIRNVEQAGLQAQMAKSLIGGLNRSDMVGKYARAGVTTRGATP